MSIKLQVALDLLNGHRALQIAQQSVDAGAQWVEAGTPLIKSEGMDILRQLREKFPDNEIIADLKTMDTGAIETEMAAKAGASIISILAAAHDETIKEAVLSARKYGVKIMADLIGITDPIKRGKQIEKLGVHFLCIHIGIDEQMKGISPLSIVKELHKQTALPIAVAGGINSEMVTDIISAGAQIIIIGGAITKAKDVKKETKAILTAIETNKSIETELFKKYNQKELYTAYNKVSTPNISDAMHKKGAMKQIKPLKYGFHMVGKALTISTMDGDWAKPVEAIDKASEGTVLVIDAQQGHTAVWGELATWSAKQKKLAGVVIDGSVRDIDDILQLDFPIFSRYTSPNAGEPKGFGEIGAEIVCGEQVVHTDDWIIGDDSGVVVVPQEIGQEIANRALDVKEHENRIREEIKQNGSLGSVLKLKKWEKKIG
jgi:3-hexulose-6-phosphate synthase / 6-phospho-3-hexuloisomerase